MACARGLLLALGIGATSLGLAQTDEKALSLLKRSMGRSFGVNVVSIMLQRDPSGDGTFQRVKLERSADGKTRHSVLQPLRLYGVEAVDDGIRHLTYLPDDKVLIDQPSPHCDQAELSLRLRLVNQNYRVKTTGQTRIAGRDAVVITATPRHYPDLETKRFMIDEKTSYPLKMESVSPSGETTVYYETKDIKYPKQLGEGAFIMKPLGRVARVRYNRPDTYSTTVAAKTAVGFSPILPRVLPYGFRVEEMQNTQDPDWRALVVRMTDGLVKATLYQWRSGGKNVDVKSYMDRSLREVNGVKLLLVSELGPRQRERILDAFENHLSAPNEPPGVGLR